MFDLYQFLDVLMAVLRQYANVRNDISLLELLNQIQLICVKRRIWQFVIAKLVPVYVELGQELTALQLLDESYLQVGEEQEPDDEDYRFVELAILAEGYAAIGQFSRAVEIAYRVGDPYLQVQTLIRITECYGAQNQREAACSLLQQASERAEEVPENSPKFYSFIHISRAYIALGERDRAMSLLTQAANIADTIGAPENDGELATLVEQYASLGQDKTALNIIQAMQVRDEGWAKMARELAKRDQIEQALNYTAMIGDLEWKDHALVEVAQFYK